MLSREGLNSSRSGCRTGRQESVFTQLCLGRAASSVSPFPPDSPVSFGGAAINPDVSRSSFDFAASKRESAHKKVAAEIACMRADMAMLLSACSGMIQQSYTPPADYELLLYLLLVAEFLLLDLAPESRIGMTKRLPTCTAFEATRAFSCPQHLKPSPLLLDTNRVLASQTEHAYWLCTLQQVLLVRIAGGGKPQQTPNCLACRSAIACDMSSASIIGCHAQEQ